MASKRFDPEQVVSKLRQIDVLMGEGKSLQQAPGGADIADVTEYGWRKEYEGLKSDPGRRLRELERESSRLKRRVADLSLEKAILREVAEGNF